jgi:hypothetical protein
MDSSEIWEYNPVYSDEIMLIGFAPLFTLTLLYHFIRNKLFKRICLISNIVISGLFAINAVFASPFLDAQDYISHVGTYILILIFPILLLILRNDNFEWDKTTP